MFPEQGDMQHFQMFVTHPLTAFAAVNRAEGTTKAPPRSMQFGSWG